MECKCGYEVRILSSLRNDFYVGTVYADGNPKCKLSCGYTDSIEAARNLELDRQGAPDNLACNKNGNCFK